MVIKRKNSQRFYNWIWKWCTLKYLYFLKVFFDGVCKNPGEKWLFVQMKNIVYSESGTRIPRDDSYGQFI